MTVSACRKEIFGAARYASIALAMALISSCAATRMYDGIEETDLSALEPGMQKRELEEIVGRRVKTYQCDEGTIVVYEYNRGYTGCVERGTCDADEEASALAADILMLGMLSLADQCTYACQVGHLNVFFNKERQLLGALESAPSVDQYHWPDNIDYCWGRGNKEHLGYPCNDIYANRHPRTLGESVLLDPSVNLELAWENRPKDSECGFFPESDPQ